MTYMLPDAAQPTSRRRLPALPTIASGFEGEEDEVLLPLPPPGGPGVGVPRAVAVSDSGTGLHRKSLSQGIGEIFDKLGLHRKSKLGPTAGEIEHL